MKGGPGEAKAAVPRPLDHLRVKVIEACKGTDYDARGCIERLSQELGAVRTSSKFLYPVTMATPFLSSTFFLSTFRIAGYCGTIVVIGVSSTIVHTLDLVSFAYRFSIRTPPRRSPTLSLPSRVKSQTETFKCLLRKFTTLSGCAASTSCLMHIRSCH